MESAQGRFFKLIVNLIVFGALAWLLYQISSTITVLIVSMLVAYILDPVASFLEYKGLSRTQATIIIFILIATVLTVTFAFLIPPIINELAAIQQNIGSGDSANFFDKIEAVIHKNVPFIDEGELDIQGRINTLVEGLASSIFSIIGSVVSIVTTIIIIPFAVFFLLKDGRDLKKAFISMIPNRRFEMALNILHKTDLQLGGYLRGQFFDALTVGILATFAMWMLDIRYYFLIGIFAGLSNMIPYVGPLAGMITAITVVLINGGGGHLIIMAAVAFIIIQLLDNVLIQPLVVAKSVNLHPLLIIFVVIIGGQFFGILGMVLAVPATGIIKVLGLEFYNGFKKYKMI